VDMTGETNDGTATEGTTGVGFAVEPAVGDGPRAAVEVAPSKGTFEAGNALEVGSAATGRAANNVAGRIALVMTLAAPATCGPGIPVTVTPAFALDVFALDMFASGDALATTLSAALDVD